jgi:hypothetical protein
MHKPVRASAHGIEEWLHHRGTGCHLAAPADLYRRDGVRERVENIFGIQFKLVSLGHLEFRAEMIATGSQIGAWDLRSAARCCIIIAPAAPRRDSLSILALAAAACFGFGPGGSSCVVMCILRHRLWHQMVRRMALPAPPALRHLPLTPPPLAVAA